LLVLLLLQPHLHLVLPLLLLSRLLLLPHLCL
jgi:hypothetical protein